jgi:hypothetical protein
MLFAPSNIVLAQGWDGLPVRVLRTEKSSHGLGPEEV